MKIGSSLESAISSLQRNVESAKAVAAEIANQDSADSSSQPSVKSNSDTVGQMVDVKA
jgi:hypothetical protein